MVLVSALVSGAAGALVAFVLYLIAPHTALHFRIPHLRDLGMMWLFVMALAPLGAWIANVALVLGSADVAWVHRLATVPALSFAGAVALVAWSAR